jgi:thymidylate synthase
MKAYLDLLEKVLNEGVIKGDRTGTGTRSLFMQTLRHDLSEGFPLLTTKKLHIKSIVHELIWFLSGDTNIQYLKDNGVSIWNEWATENGDLGPVYGAQWRKWPDGNGGHIDQISNLVDGLKNNPDSRRHIFHAWNVADLPDESISPQENALQGKMALPPCHLLYQFYVANGKLSGGLWCRSTDSFLGLPYNLSSLSFLTHMLAQQCDLEVGEVAMTMCDFHLYSNHVEQAKIQLQRDPLPLPTLSFARKPDSIFDYKFEDFIIDGYEAHPSIKAPIAV